MTVGVSPLGSSAVVEIADDLVERYEAQGWVRVKPKSTRSKKSGDDSKSDDK